MPSYTIYAGIDDFTLQTSTFSTWDEARNAAAGSPTGASNAIAAVGALFDGSSYLDRIGNFSFDTSAVEGSVTDASFSVVVSYVYNTSTSPTWEWRVNSWLNGNSGWITGTSLSTKPLSASATVGTTTGRKNFPAGPSSIAKSSVFKVTLADARKVSGVAPTALEIRDVFLADESGTTNDPYLSITTVDVRYANGSPLERRDTSTAAAKSVAKAGGSPIERRDTTSSATAVVKITAGGSPLERRDTAFATAKLRVAAGGSPLERRDTATAAARARIAAGGSPLERRDTATAFAFAPPPGAKAYLTERRDTAQGTGVSRITAGGSPLERRDTATAAGALAGRGAASVVERRDTAVAAAAAPTKAGGSPTERRDTTTAAGRAPVRGTGGGLETRDTLEARGVGPFRGDPDRVAPLFGGPPGGKVAALYGGTDRTAGL